MPPITPDIVKVTLALVLITLVLLQPLFRKPPARKEPTVEDANEGIVTLIDEEGAEHSFIVVDIVEFEGTDYALLTPADPEDDSDEAELLLLKFKGDDELVMLEDDDELRRVAEYLNSLAEAEA